MSQDRSHVCLEARIDAVDPSLVRASVERWLAGVGAGTAAGDGLAGTVPCREDATVHVESGGDGALSVFLHASGEDAARAVAGHGSDLVHALGRSGGDVDLTWVRHLPPGVG